MIVPGSGFLVGPTSASYQFPVRGAWNETIGTEYWENQYGYRWTGTAWLSTPLITGNALRLKSSFFSVLAGATRMRVTYTFNLGSGDYASISLVDVSSGYTLYASTQQQFTSGIYTQESEWFENNKLGLGDYLQASLDRDCNSISFSSIQFYIP